MRRQKRQADRVATARADRDSEALTDAASQVERDKRDRIDRLLDEAAKLVPEALKALAARDYEGIREVRLARKRFPPLGDLLGYKIERVGGYVVCTYDHPHSYGHRAGPSEFLLLSDGRLMPGDTSGNTYSLEEFAERVRAAEGLGRHERSPDGDMELEPPFSTEHFSDFVSGLRQLATPTT
jgi:hypothetical protein